MSSLINVDVAIERILSHISELPGESVPIDMALHRIVSENILSTINLPPFANSSMDGYAVRAQDVQNASQGNPVRLRVTMDIPAGTTPTESLATGEAARIMTGAPIPDGADAIVPVENTDATWDKSDPSNMSDEVLIFESVDVGAFIRPIGENVSEGQLIISKGVQIRAQEIGMLASTGHSRVTVRRQPRVVILSTGDELVAIEQPLAQGQIYDSNSHMIAALVKARGAIAIRLPVAHDTYEDVRTLFENAMTFSPNLILSSAGVSVGAADYVRDVVEELGSIDLWRINLRPGKPLAFGHVQDIPFIGLPGNPVSAMVTFEVFVNPVLDAMSGINTRSLIIEATTDEEIQSDGRRSYLRVLLHLEDDGYHARLTGTQSSGALMSMVAADGLLIVPEDITYLAPNTRAQVQLLKPIAHIK